MYRNDVGPYDYSVHKGGHSKRFQMELLDRHQNRLDRYKAVADRHFDDDVMRVEETDPANLHSKLLR